MAFPANLAAALAQPGATILSWIEIEGLRYAYGNRAQAAAFWTSLASGLRFDELKSYLTEVPPGVDARLDPLEGMASSGEFEFHLIDGDGYLTQAMNVGREAYDPDRLVLSADAAKGSATLNVLGSTTNWPASGIGYIGRCTFSYAGKTGNSLTGVVQGLYRSQDQDHATGEGITMYPAQLYRRRCWHYLAAADTQGAFNVADRGARYAGTIDDCEMDQGGAGYVLKVRTAERELEEAQAFRGLRKGTLATGIPGP
jgi:hypothetical protein